MQAKKGQRFQAVSAVPFLFPYVVVFCFSSSFACIRFPAEKLLAERRL